MDKEARELQIKLAQLQTDIRIFTSAVFGFIAIAGAFLVAGYQVGFDGIVTNNNLKVLLAIAFFFIAVLALWQSEKAYKNLSLCRDELYNLK